MKAHIMQQTSHVNFTVCGNTPLLNTAQGLNWEGAREYLLMGYRVDGVGGWGGEYRSNSSGGCMHMLDCTKADNWHSQ